MLKVGVLMGGMSIEREVSFNSGRTICDHLDTDLFQVVPLFQTAQGLLYILPWTFLYRGKIADFQHRLAQQAQQVTWDELPSLIDFMYIAVHGKYAEDGTLQAMLELLKIPYLGSKKLASALGMNKYIHNKFLQAHHIKVPQGFYLIPSKIIHYNQQEIINLIQQHNLQFPLIVKPNNEGSSFGVFVVHHEDDLEKAIKKACFISCSKGQAVLVEEKISGMEFTCIIITDIQTDQLKALPPTEVLLQKNSQYFDYQQKYTPGAVHEKTPANCSAHLITKIQETCISAMQILGFTNLARIDGFLTEQEDVVIIDSNPLSGMGPATFLFRQAAELNIGHTELINHLIKTELKSYHMEKSMITKTDLTTPKLRVGVLLGGPSNEKEISLESGRNVIYKLSPKKYEIIPLFLSDDLKLHKIDNRLLVCHSTQEIKDQLDQTELIPWSSLSQQIDFAFIALHGAPGEDGTIQGALEMLQIPYNGSGVFTSSLCMDKFKTNQFLTTQGFHVPQSILLSIDEWKYNHETLNNFLNTITYPCIVKPHDDGCSVMVQAPQDIQQVGKALEDIFLHKKYALIEEYIKGMELTVGVIGNDDPHVLTPSQTITKGDLLSLEEKFLPGAGENQTPALLDQNDIDFVKEEIKKVYQAIAAKGYVRIDCFFQNAEQSVTGQRRLIIIEINTLPALTPATCIFHQAAEEGIRPMEFIDTIISLGLQEHQKSSIVSVDQALELQKNI